MGILSFYPGIENLGSSLGFLPPFVTENHDTFFIFGIGWETMSDNLWGEISRLLRKWEVSSLDAYFLSFFLDSLVKNLLV